MKIKLFLPIFCMLICSCEPTLDYNLSGYTQKIIVEGYITSNNFAKVYLSLNIPLSQKIDSVEMLKNFISVAKVTVSDGVNTEVLTGGYQDENHYPPFYYATTDLKGKEGGTYTLTVEYAGHVIHSTTTIPYSDFVTNFQYIVVNDSMRNLRMGMDINSKTKGSYKLYSLKSIDYSFVATPFMFNSNLSLTGYNEFLINPKPTKDDKSYSQRNLFKVGDDVVIQVNKIDSSSTAFFSGISFGAVNGVGSEIFIGQKDALNSNVSSPGFGIWCGIAKRTYRVLIK